MEMNCVCLFQCCVYASLLCRCYLSEDNNMVPEKMGALLLMWKENQLLQVVVEGLQLPLGGSWFLTCTLLEHP